jgi:hypothetical protein
MWVVGCFVQACDAYGYRIFDNCSTSRYSLVCHDLWKRLLISSLWVQAKGLCLFTTNITHRIECDCRLCDFVCSKRRSYLLKYYCRKDKMVRHGRTMCIIVHHVIFPMWMAKLTHPWPLYMLVCNRCSRGWHMACLTPPLDQLLVGKWFCPPCTL